MRPRNGPAETAEMLQQEAFCLKERTQWGGGKDTKKLTTWFMDDPYGVYLYEKSFLVSRMKIIVGMDTMQVNTKNAL